MTNDHFPKLRSKELGNGAQCSPHTTKDTVGQVFSRSSSFHSFLMLIRNPGLKIPAHCTVC